MARHKERAHRLDADREVRREVPEVPRAAAPAVGKRTLVELLAAGEPGEPIAFLARALREARAALDRDPAAVERCLSVARAHLAELSPAIQAIARRELDEVEEARRGGEGEPALVEEARRGGQGEPALVEEARRGGEGDVPYRGEMERAFGEDFSTVHARVGASEVSAMDALGLARGEHVAFAEARPDRFVVAHELAHVVQRRRATAAPTEAIEPDGSAAEREADDVATRVAAGERAPSIRASLVGEAARILVVTRLPGQVPKPPDANRWLDVHRFAIHGGVMMLLSGMRLATGHPRLAWAAHPARLAFEVWTELAANPQGFGDRLTRALAPFDLGARVDALRPPDETSPDAKGGSLTYVPEIAVTIARELERALAGSLKRLGPRYAGAADAARDPLAGEPRPLDVSTIDPAAIVASHAIDAAAIQALRRSGIAVVAPPSSEDEAPALDRAATGGRAGLRKVTFAWVEDPALYNWIRVQPADATPEEVALALFGATTRATELQACPPLYGVPRDAVDALAPARVLPAVAAMQRAVGTDGLLPAAIEASRGVTENKLAASKHGEEAGLAQAARLAKAHGAAELDAAELAGRCRSQLDLMGVRYADLGAAAKLVGLAGRLDARTRRLPTAAADARASFAALFQAQSDVLYTVAGELEPLLAKARPPGAKGPEPMIVELAAPLLDAAALADLPETARSRLRDAIAARQTAAFDAYEAMLDDARGRTMSVESISKKDAAFDLGSHAGSMTWTGIREREKKLAEEVLAARRAQAAGTAKPEDAQLLGERVRALQVEARLAAAIRQCDYLGDRLNAEEGVVAFISGQMGDLQSARNELRRLAGAIGGVLGRWREQNHYLFESIKGGAPLDGEPVRALRATIAKLEEELVSVGDEKIQKALETAYDELQDMAVARMIVEIAVMIGLTLVTGGLGSLAAGAARGLRLGRLAVALADIGTQSVTMASFRALMHGDSFFSALASELGTNLAGFAALRGLAHGLANLRVGKVLAAAKESGTAWKYLAHGAELTIEAATQAGLQFAIAQAESLIKNGRTLNDAELKQLAIQGIGMFIGNAVAHRLAAPALDHIAAYGARIGRAYNHKQVRQLAQRVGKSGDPAEVRELLAQERDLVRQEQTLLREMASDPAQRGLAGKETIAELQAQAASHASAVAAMTVEHAFQSGLAETAPGAMWEGPAARVEHALGEARAAGATVESKKLPDGGIVHHVRLGTRSFHIKERVVAEPRAEVDVRASGQADALVALHAGNASQAQRTLLAAEIRRQVPQVALSVAVAEGRARTVIVAVTPGGGATGIKSLNDKLVGHALADKLIAARNDIVHDVFAKHGIEVVQTDYKTITLASSKPAAELGEALRLSIQEIGTRMRPKLAEVLGQGHDHWTATRDQHAPGTKDHDAADARVKAIDEMRKKLAADPTLTFGMSYGAAEVAGGKRAAYADVLAAEMNANKAAIMTRDASVTRTGATSVGDPRGMIYSAEHFTAFAKETVAKRKALAKESLPWNGERRRVVDDAGVLDRDLARAARKSEFDRTGWTDGQRATLARLEEYMTRVNTLDYMTRVPGKEVAAQGPKVQEAIALVKQLESDRAITRDAAQQVSATLAGKVAQAGTASEAQFFHRAASARDRVVLNADIKDLGLDVLAGNARAVESIARGGNIDRASRTASDHIIEQKREMVKQLEELYRGELVPEARRRAIDRKRHDLLKAIDAEPRPLFLLGGDEVTISLPRAFEELGLVPRVIDHLKSRANARVAETHTDHRRDAAAAHAEAMKGAELGHDRLKKYEQVARDLRQLAERLPADKRSDARKLAAVLDGLYTSQTPNGMVVKNRDGTEAIHLDAQTTRAEALLAEARGMKGTAP